MMTDPIADFLIQIKNAYLAGKEKVSVPYSKMKKEIAELLVKEGYLAKVELNSKDKVKKYLNLELAYQGKKPKLTDIVRISKPGRKIYVKKNKIPKVIGGLGLAIVSTPKGILTDKEARKRKLGGELIFKLW